MKPIDLLFAVSLILMVVITAVLAVAAIFAPLEISSEGALLLFVITLGFGAFTLLYVRFRLMPIAYPALYRKDGDE